jgi:hypothetical protein
MTSFLNSGPCEARDIAVVKALADFIPAASPRDRDSYARQSAFPTASYRYEVISLAWIGRRSGLD